MDAESAKLPNIIFLDFDGVICTPRVNVAMNVRGMHSFLDCVACHLIKRICEETNSQLVISSTWRRLYDYNSIVGILNAACPSLGNYVLRLPDWSDSWRTTTEYIPNSCRGDEIALWLKKYSDYYNMYVILDDDSDMLEEQMSRFVQCDVYDGMGYKQFCECINLLKDENGNS